MPELDACMRGLDDAALVTVVTRGSVPHIQAALRATAFGGLVLRDVSASGEALVTERWGVDRLPWHVVLDQRGHGAAVLTGRGDCERITRVLDRL